MTDIIAKLAQLIADQQARLALDKLAADLAERMAQADRKNNDRSV